MADLGELVKAYDIRGTYPDPLNEQVTRAAGAAFVRVVGAQTVVVGRDMRASSPTLAEAFAAGAASQGADVIDIGLASTDLVYYAAGSLGLPAAVITASHNPAGYNGIKFCRAGAAPVGQDSGLADIRRLLQDGVPDHSGPAGTIRRRDLLADYTSHLRSLVDLTGIRPLTVVIDAGNGMAGHTVPAVLGDQLLPALPLLIVPLYLDLDGTFPNHDANPLDPTTLVDLQKAVRETGADLGLAFDGDADRCFVIDENGEPVPPSAIVALIATRELTRRPGSAVVYNAITSAAVPQIIVEHGGRPVRERVGHSFMKATMAREDAVFGGEHSGHYYFTDFWRADTGMLAALHVLGALGETDQPLSTLTSQYTRYAASGEINNAVTNTAATLDRVEAHFADRAQPGTDRLDGLTVILDSDAWFNLRPSNTEPVLRLNVEAASIPAMALLRDEVLALLSER
jgi:phosphomannomutase